MLRAPLPSSSQGDEALPDEPHGLVTHTGAQCQSLCEWLQAGIGSDEGPMARSSKLPSGYSYQYSQAVGCVTLRHANGIVIEGKPVVVAPSISEEYIFGFHYCSADSFRAVLKQPDRWPSLHLACTMQREPALFEGEPAVRATLIAEGLADGELEVGKAACCIPVMVPHDWLKVPGRGVPVPDANGKGAKLKRSRRPRREGSSDASRKSEFHGRKGSSQSRSSSAEDGQPRRHQHGEHRHSASRRAVTEAQPGAAGLAKLAEEGSNAGEDVEGPAGEQELPERLAVLECMAATQKDPSRSSSPCHRKCHPREGKVEAPAVAPSESPQVSPQVSSQVVAFIRATMFKWTSLRFCGGGNNAEELCWELHSCLASFDVFARAEGPSRGGEFLMLSLSLFGDHARDDGSTGSTGGVSATLSIEKTTQSTDRVWVLAGTGTGKKAGRVRTGLLPCKEGGTVPAAFWLSFAKRTSGSGFDVLLGEGWQVGDGQLLHLEVPGTMAAAFPLPRLRVTCGGDGPWSLEVGHTDRFHPGAIRDLEAATNNLNLQDAEGRSVLMHAVLEGDEEVLEALLDAQANVHARDQAHCTALHHAVYLGHAGAIARLLKRGASSFSKNCSGFSPYELARVRWLPRLPGEGEEWAIEDDLKAKERTRLGKEVWAALAHGTGAHGTGYGSPMP